MVYVLEVGLHQQAALPLSVLLQDRAVLTVNDCSAEICRVHFCGGKVAPESPQSPFQMNCPKRGHAPSLFCSQQGDLNQLCS